MAPGEGVEPSCAKRVCLTGRSLTFRGTQEHLIYGLVADTACVALADAARLEVIRLSSHPRF